MIWEALEGGDRRWISSYATPAFRGATVNAALVNIGIIDARRRLVSPGLIETHIHLDKSRILNCCTPTLNRGRDHMRRVAAVKPGFTVEDAYRRASAALEECLVRGTRYMRTHVEVDANAGLRGFEAICRLASDLRWAIDVEHTRLAAAPKPSEKNVWYQCSRFRNLTESGWRLRASGGSSTTKPSGTSFS